MTTQIKILLALLLAAAITLVVTLYSADQDDTLAAERLSDSDVQNSSDNGPVGDLVGTAKDKDKSATRDLEPVRVRADSTTSGADYAQGVQGFLIDENDQPVADARLFLMPGMGFDGLQMYRQHQQGVRFPPLARTVSKKRAWRQDQQQPTAVGQHNTAHRLAANQYVHA